MTPVRLSDAERDLILSGLFELTITYVEDSLLRHKCKVLAARFGGDRERDVLRPAPGGAAVSSTWRIRGRPVGGFVSVLFTSDRRVFFQHEDGTIRVAADWERDEVLLQMLSWQAVAAPPAEREEPAEP